MQDIKYMVLHSNVKGRFPVLFWFTDAPRRREKRLRRASGGRISRLQLGTAEKGGAAPVRGGAMPKEYPLPQKAFFFGDTTGIMSPKKVSRIFS